jgi:hypothetical protein
MFLTHFDNKSQCRWRGNYISRVIISPALSIHTRDWWCDSDITFCSPPTKEKCSQGLLCKITLNWKLSHKYEKWCKYSSCVKVKLHKNKSHFRKHTCWDMFYVKTNVWPHLTASQVMCQNCVAWSLYVHTLYWVWYVCRNCLLTNTVQGSAAVFPNCMLLRIGMQVVFWLLAVEVVAVG